MKLHPASWLWTWLCAVLTLQLLPLPLLAAALPPLAALALWRAGSRLRSLLRRARWLLLSIVLLFALATPGISLPGLAGTLGLTESGVDLAATHALRLILLLAMLALLLERLSIPALVAGLHKLLAPLGATPWRDRLAVRLMLVLESVEQGQQLRRRGESAGWRDWLTLQAATAPTDPPASIELSQSPLRAHDLALMALTACGAAGAFACVGAPA